MKNVKKIVSSLKSSLPSHNYLAEVLYIVSGAYISFDAGSDYACCLSKSLISVAECKPMLHQSYTFRLLQMFCITGVCTM